MCGWLRRWVRECRGEEVEGGEGGVSEVDAWKNGRVGGWVVKWVGG